MKVKAPSFAIVTGIIFSKPFAEALTFQPEFAEPIVNISVAIGRDATFTCHVRHLGGYRVN